MAHSDTRACLRVSAETRAPRVTACLSACLRVSARPARLCTDTRNRPRPPPCWPTSPSTPHRRDRLAHPRPTHRSRSPGNRSQESCSKGGQTGTSRQGIRELQAEPLRVGTDASDNPPISCHAPGGMGFTPRVPGCCESCAAARPFTCHDREAGSAEVALLPPSERTGLLRVRLCLRQRRAS